MLLVRAPWARWLGLGTAVAAMVTMAVAGFAEADPTLDITGGDATVDIPCTDRTDCDDGSVCTDDGCRQGICVFRVIDARPDVQDAPDAVDYEFKGGRIEFENVDFGYVPGSLVLRDNTFDVVAQSVTGVTSTDGRATTTDFSTT